MPSDHGIDYWVASLLVPLAIWVLINGLDDLFIDFAALWGYVRLHFATHPNEIIPTEDQLDAAPPLLMAVFVALWKEHKVIQKMIENNVTKLRYTRFEFFVGAYPNDAPTLAAIREAMKRFPNVHLSVCPHDGPTSKADCLNWIYQRMLLHEEKHNLRFDMILTHDAEDLMDPDALRWINYYAQWNDFVQIPSSPSPTPVRELSPRRLLRRVRRIPVQGYDGPARPSAVSYPQTASVPVTPRRALEMLAANHSNRIFEPACSY